MNNAKIKALALQHGFKLKEQKGGCGAHGNTKCEHKVAANESKVTA